MKKTVICNISMKEIVEETVYLSNDLSVPVSDRAVRYPVNAFLEKNLSEGEEVKVILLLKKDEFGHYQKNKEDFEKELNEVIAQCNAQVSIKVIDTEFSQEIAIHEQLMGRIIDEIEDESHIIADITFGPKDVPIIVFAALGFAEKFLGCEVDAIVYGQASFVDGHVVNTKICDMSPLYYLSSVANTIKCEEPQKARKTLKSLLSL